MSWEQYKLSMAMSITEKVFEEDAYNRQKSYMQERIKPRKLPSAPWHARIQILNQYLPFLLPSLEALQDEIPSAKWNDWWILGGLSTAEERRIIINKAPEEWIDSMDLNDIKRSYLTQDPRETIAHYTRREAIESKRSMHKTTINSQAVSSPAFPAQFSRRLLDRYGRSVDHGSDRTSRPGRGNDRTFRGNERTNNYGGGRAPPFKNYKRRDWNNQSGGQRKDRFQQSQNKTQNNRGTDNLYQEEEEEMIDQWGDHFNMGEEEEEDDYSDDQSSQKDAAVKGSQRG
jgi:hypothetical protein